VKSVALLYNPVQNYAWGSRTAIAKLQGRNTPSAQPEAELWMGAHPRAPSQVDVGGRRERLDLVIGRDPIGILGRRVAERFGGRLPFLLKLLASEEPLSIQVHPDEARAREGFARETAAGIPLDAPQRCYRDAEHKPELVCALAPFIALRGFRTPAEIRARLERLGTPGLAPVRRALAGDADAERALRGLLGGLFGMDAAGRRRAVREAVDAAQALADGDPALAWMPRLQASYPDDIGVLAPLFLNLVRLEPGDGMFLAPGELHAYLGGTAIEVMASSDNVLRGGLTQKHVDVEEMLRVLRFDPAGAEILRPRRERPGLEIYRTPAREFELSRLTPGADPLHLPGGGVEILLCVEGPVRVQARSASDDLCLDPGASCLVAASAGPYLARGPGVLYRASVPA
jgi:mannose-6-phosphate isomerase